MRFTCSIKRLVALTLVGACNLNAIGSPLACQGLWDLYRGAQPTPSSPLSEPEVLRDFYNFRSPNYEDRTIGFRWLPGERIRTTLMFRGEQIPVFHFLNQGGEGNVYLGFYKGHIATFKKFSVDSRVDSTIAKREFLSRHLDFLDGLGVSLSRIYDYSAFDNLIIGEYIPGITVADIAVIQEANDCSIQDRAIMFRGDRAVTTVENDQFKIARSVYLSRRTMTRRLRKIENEYALFAAQLVKLSESQLFADWYRELPESIRFQFDKLDPNPGNFVFSHGRWVLIDP